MCFECYLTHLYYIVSLRYSVDLAVMMLCYCVVVDGLTDCVDPDCCQQSSCHSGPLCQGSPDPLDLIQQSQTPFASLLSRLFYDRVHFLVGKDSTHVFPGDIPFDSR